jgi:hypothetical protein
MERLCVWVHGDGIVESKRPRLMRRRIRWGVNVRRVVHDNIPTFTGCHQLYLNQKFIMKKRVRKEGEETYFRVTMLTWRFSPKLHTTLQAGNLLPKLRKQGNEFLRRRDAIPKTTSCSAVVRYLFVLSQNEIGRIVLMPEKM